MAPVTTPSPRVPAPALKAAYNVTELAEMSGLSRKMIARAIKDSGVPRLYDSREAPILLVHIETLFPDFWESVKRMWLYSTGNLSS